MLVNVYDKIVVVKLIEIIDKNNNFIYIVIVIWVLGEIVKKLNDEILEFMSNLILKDEDSWKELELICYKW